MGHEKRKEKMVATLIVSLITCIILIVSILTFPKIKMFNKKINTYWIVCLIGAIFILLFKGVSVKESMLALFENSSINPIKILIFFFSMTFLSIFLDEEKLNKSISQTAAVEHMNFEVNNDVLKQDYPSQIESTSTTNTIVETLEDVPMQKYH